MIQESIGKIFASASKLAFLGLMGTACIAFLFGILEASHFMTLANGAAIFYFTHKGEKGKDFAGK